MSRWYLVLVALLFSQNLAAQGTVVRPEPRLDAGRVALRDTLLQFRDSLNSVAAAASRLQRDFRQSSAASLLSRARTMHQACARSLRTLPGARKTVLEAEAANPRQLQRRGEMVAALDQLQKALVRCQADFAAMSRAGEAERVRGYGNDRAGRVVAAMRRYEGVLGQFLSSMGIKVNPLGAGTRPLAG